MQSIRLNFFYRPSGNVCCETRNTHVKLVTSFVLKCKTLSIVQSQSEVDSGSVNKVTRLRVSRKTRVLLLFRESKQSSSCQTTKGSIFSTFWFPDEIIFTSCDPVLYTNTKARALLNNKFDCPHIIYLYIFYR